MPLGFVNRKNVAVAGSSVAELQKQFNDLCDLVRAIAVKLDAETLAASDYAATVDAGVAKLKDENGKEF